MEKADRIVFKVGIVGPEAAGKTQLAMELSDYFSEPFLAEFAREYLEQKNGLYEKADLDFIALEQLKSEEKALRKAKKILFCDTTPLVVKVWSDYKYGNCSKAIIDVVKKSAYDLYFLLSPDLEYKDDPLRENPSYQDRLELFKIYEEELITSNETFHKIEGQGKSRFENALKILKSNFSF